MTNKHRSDILCFLVLKKMHSNIYNNFSCVTPVDLAIMQEQNRINNSKSYYENW